jgi:hypothetical protein
LIWTLDTCGFDDTNQNCQFEMTDKFEFIRAIRKCPAHQNQEFNNVYEENRRGPGNALGELLNRVPPTMIDTLPDGSKDFKKDINVSWSWSGQPPNRVLTITVTGTTLNATQRTAITTALNNRFGAGKVVLA